MNRRSAFSTITILLILVLFVSIMAGCVTDGQSDTTSKKTNIPTTQVESSTTQTQETTSSQTATTSSFIEGTSTYEATIETTAETTIETTVETTAETTIETTVETVTATTTTVDGVNMYSSYAIMKSIDYQKGLAQFDFVIMLDGIEMEDWLVENKGYTRDEASYHEPPYVIVNNNPQLRTIDLHSVNLSYIYGGGTTVCDYQKFTDVFKGSYENDWSFLFYISVDNNGKPFAVDQVFTP